MWKKKCQVIYFQDYDSSCEDPQKKFMCYSCKAFDVGVCNPNNTKFGLGNW